MELIEDGYSDGKTKLKSTENIAFSPGQAQLTPWAGTVFSEAARGAESDHNTDLLRNNLFGGAGQ